MLLSARREGLSAHLREWALALRPSPWPKAALKAAPERAQSSLRRGGLFARVGVWPLPPHYKVTLSVTRGVTPVYRCNELHQSLHQTLHSGIWCNAEWCNDRCNAGSLHQVLHQIITPNHNPVIHRIIRRHVPPLIWRDQCREERVTDISCKRVTVNQID